MDNTHHDPVASARLPSALGHSRPPPRPAPCLVEARAEHTRVVLDDLPVVVRAVPVAPCNVVFMSPAWGRQPYACEHIAALKARFLGEAWAQEALRKIVRRINRRRR
jgi:hypothetical protein